MTTKEAIALAKEKLGRDITAQEAQNYFSGKEPIPDEALAIISGGSECDPLKCEKCGSEHVKRLWQLERIGEWKCSSCGYQWLRR